jgi:integrase
MLITLFPKASRKYLSLPLFGPVMDDFSDWLEQEGYTRKSRRYAIRMIAWMDAYLRRRRIERLQELTPVALHGCWKALQRRLPPAAGTVHVMERFLTERGLLKPSPRRVSSPTEIQLQRYSEYLRDVRGVSRSTVHSHLYTAAGFLAHVGFDHEPHLLAGVDANDLEGFLRKVSKGLTRGTIQHTVAALRGFLRFLATTGEVTPGLDSQIDTPRLYRQEQLPRALPWETVQALLQSIPRNNLMGRRDHAILFLMATYGLRASQLPPPEAVACFELHLEGARGPKLSVLLEELPLHHFDFSFSLFLPADILTNHLFVDAHCADAIAPRPQVAAPILAPQLRIPLEELQCQLPFQEAHHLTDRILRRDFYHHVDMIRLHV